MNRKVRIRTVFIVALFAIGLMPLAGFTYFSFERTLAREYDEVQERHLLLAQNLSASLSNYERDLRFTARAVALDLERYGKSSRHDAMLDTMHIECVSLVDPYTGRVVSRLVNKNTRQPDGDITGLVAAASLVRGNGRWRFEPVRKVGQKPAIYLVGNTGMHLVVARISTDYFTQLGGQVSFGDMGHAAIVDQVGNVLSHPLKSWEDEVRNISGVSTVQRMMKGETGVQEFWSPALKGNMVAGFTSVPGTGWGVMIPQPVKELEAKAFENIMPMIAGLLLALVTAVAFIKLLMVWLARPLENLANDLNEQVEAGRTAMVPHSRTQSTIREVEKIVDAYNQLASHVDNTARDLEEATLRDGVTGIGNRVYFEEAGQSQIDQRICLSRRGVLIFIDLDGFKEINDVRGHAVGDAMLAAFAKTLYPTVKRFMDSEFRGVTGAHPIIARIGGDEFAILMPLPDEDVDVADLCARLRSTLPTELIVDGSTMPCRLSAGGALYPENGTCIEELLRRADVALYVAKTQGRARFSLYSPDHALGGKSEILAAVMTAIEKDELLLEYQPKLCLVEGRVKSVEALVRWEHPTIGRISPGLFLPAMEKTDAMTKLGEWVVDRAIRDMSALDMHGHKLAVAVNIGAEHFSADGFVEGLTRQCTAAGFDPSRMEIEVTEDVMDVSREAFIRTVEAVRGEGFTVAIDDFGKGFSNLSRLASTPVDVIKLDRSLVSGSISSPRLGVIMGSSIDMAHSLGSQVVVEGVETLEEVEFARKAGADSVQGFYLARSMEPEKLAGWMDERSENPQHEQMAKLRRRLEAA